MEDKKTTWPYRVIRVPVRALTTRYRMEGTDNLPEEPCVIVGNHSQMYGPLAAEFRVPGRHYTWCAGEMMHRREVPDYAYRDFWAGKPRAVRWFYRLLSYLIAPLAELIFTNAHTVAVYHDSRLITTFRESVELLQKGYSLVIFPERYEEHNNIVHSFQDRFVDLARVYYRKTGRELLFVPMYLAPRRKTMSFCPPIRFRADAPAADERRRICGALMDAITETAVAMPEHTVVPYPNIPKRQYPKNIPLEVYDEQKAKG